MAEPENATPEKIDRGRSLRLWIGLLLPPVAWAVQLQVLYLTSEFGCRSGTFFWNHVAVGVGLLLSIVGGLIAWREWMASGTIDNEGGGELPRRRFMAMLGVLASGLFALTIFAQWLPTLMGVPCDK